MSTTPAPHLILHHARIYTQDSSRPWAQALAIWNGRILALGDNDEMRSLARPHTRQLHLDGALVLPGFTDSHIHFFDMAQRRQQLNLTDATNLEDALARVRAHVEHLPAGAWLLGYGWNESGWDQPRYPDRHNLDPITGDHPALLWRSDMHAAWANSAALRAAGIDSTTPDPAGGVFDRDGSGQPTGIVRELAVNVIRDAIPPPDETAVAEDIVATAADLHRLGIIAVHDQRMKGQHEEGPQAMQLYARLQRQQRLPLRISVNVEAANLDHLIALGLHSGFGNEWLRVGHIKLFADGSLGARTAWMLEPYEDEPDNAGLNITPLPELTDAIQRAFGSEG